MKKKCKVCGGSWINGVHMSALIEEKELKQYEAACNALKDKFLSDLYAGEEDYSVDDDFWVGEEIGGILSWGDWFVSMDDIVGYYRCGFTPDEFFEWYDSSLEETLKGKKKGNPLNMRSWKKLKE